MRAVIIGKSYSSFDLAMMRQNGMSYIEIAQKTGMNADVVKERIRQYRQGVKYYAIDGANKRAHGNTHKHHKQLHPEQG